MWLGASRCAINWFLKTNRWAFKRSFLGFLAFFTTIWNRKNNLSFGIPSGHLWFLRWSSIKWKLWWRCYYLFPQKNLDAELSEYGVGFQRKSIASSLLGSSSGCWFPEGGLNSCARRFSECDWMAPRKTSTSSGRSPVLEGENQISQRSLSIHLFPTCSQRVQLQGWCFL